MAKVKKLSKVSLDHEAKRRAGDIQDVVNQKLGEADKEFSEKKWSEITLKGNPVAPLPETVVEDFKKAYFDKFSSVMHHVAKAIGQSTHGDIKYNQVYSILQVIAGAEPKSIAANFDEYIAKRERYDLIIQMTEEVHNEHRANLEELKQTILAEYDPKTFLPIKTSKFHN
jgi:predicted transcriptional regulator